MANETSPKTQKAAVRDEARARRRQLADRAARSGVICRKLVEDGAFLAARKVLLYVHTQSEVQTTDAIEAMLERGKELFVPYCVGDELRLFRLDSLDELEPGTFGILEPKPSLRTLKERHKQVDQMDLVIVPGVAFDRSGNRLGQGRGYYDRLLTPIAARPLGQRPEFVGLAFECQMLDTLPHGPHDVKMDRVITA